MKTEEISQEAWEEAEEWSGWPLWADLNNEDQATIHEGVARAILAAEKRGEEATHAKMATLLKDPAAVRVNYLRGDIACQGLIQEAEEREREACARYVEGHGDVIPGSAVFAPLVSRNNMPCVSGDPRDRLHSHVRRSFDDATEALAAAIRNRGKP